MQLYLAKLSSLRETSPSSAYLQAVCALTWTCTVCVYILVPHSVCIYVAKYV